MLGTSDTTMKFFPYALTITSEESTWSYSKMLQAMKNQQSNPEFILGDAHQGITAGKFLELILFVCNTRGGIFRKF